MGFGDGGQRFRAGESLARIRPATALGAGFLPHRLPQASAPAWLGANFSSRPPGRGRAQLSSPAVLPPPPRQPRRPSPAAPLPGPHLPAPRPPPGPTRPSPRPPSPFLPAPASASSRHVNPHLLLPPAVSPPSSDPPPSPLSLLSPLPPSDPFPQRLAPISPSLTPASPCIPPSRIPHLPSPPDPFLRPPDFCSSLSASQSSTWRVLDLLSPPPASRPPLRSPPGLGSPLRLGPRTGSRPCAALTSSGLPTPGSQLCGSKPGLGPGLVRAHRARGFGRLLLLS